MYWKLPISQFKSKLNKSRKSLDFLSFPYTFQSWNFSTNLEISLIPATQMPEHLTRCTGPHLKLLIWTRRIFKKFMKAVSLDHIAIFLQPPESGRKYKTFRSTSKESSSLRCPGKILQDCSNSPFILKSISIVPIQLFFIRMKLERTSRYARKTSFVNVPPLSLPLRRVKTSLVLFYFI